MPRQFLTVRPWTQNLAPRSIDASLLVAQGVDLVEVSKLLGHSELRTTADPYAHLQRETAAKAARVMDGLFGEP